MHSAGEWAMQQWATAALGDGRLQRRAVHIGSHGWSAKVRTNMIVDCHTHVWQSPDQLGYPAVNWTIPLLQEQLGRCTGQWPSEDTLRRQLHRLDYVWKRPRYVLDPDPELEKKKTASQANQAVAAPDSLAG